jgi:hypothetical protein
VTGRLTGTARFTPERGGLRYAEGGTLIFGAYHGTASQNYGFGLSNPDLAAVQFDDGRPFHQLDLRTGRAEIFHACAPDDYRGRYRVDRWTTWSLVWRIKGPRKDLRIATRYHRA